MNLHLSLRFLLISQISLLIVALMMTSSYAQLPANEESIFIHGEIVVKFKEQNKQRVGQQILRSMGLHASELFTCTQSMRVQVQPGDEAKTIAELTEHSEVEFATYNYRIQALEVPDDPEFSRQWALDETTNDNDIDAPEAWDITTGSDSVIVAIIDSGIDLNHPEFTGRIMTGYNYIDPSALPEDGFSHGTHVAGIVGAAGNNGVGISGVSWNVRLMPLKILDDNGNGDSANLAKSICFAVDNGAKIINMSIGDRNSSWPCKMADVEEAFKYAESKGVLLVGAAGNDSSESVNCPAAYEQAIAVSSVTDYGGLSSFSNYGEQVDIAAPGGGGARIYSTVPGGYDYKQGTSMATPHVSGVAALIWSLKPDLSHHEVREILETTTDDLGAVGWDKIFGWGRVNARQSLESLTRLQVELVGWESKIDDGDQIPVLKQVNINPGRVSSVVTWTATISPTVPWVELSSKNFGELSTTNHLDVQIYRPTDYGIYTTTLYIDGGPKIGITRTELKINYKPQWHDIYLPMLSK
jgi:subtilisin family serine protease